MSEAFARGLIAGWIVAVVLVCAGGFTVQWIALRRTENNRRNGRVGMSGNIGLVQAKRKKR